ncbi:hypothetical protein D2T29_19755 [Sinirhodobacter populi]|uniref:Uncharacterized protein n=1 Tax=Paenirhodobacter populi TaxID=2306993 RepID=A0A443K244_9RHOB|nr:hypothetical protein [Sinirhodobacter populi]RWR26815.1 hypothetical protein D2T29_19755 [Sinirhodobacter populi]
MMHNLNSRIGPRVAWLNGEGPEAYQIEGWPGDTPTFRTRGEAERWLRDHFDELPKSHRPGERQCLCCGATFTSEGFHNRLCAYCRQSANSAQPAAALVAGTHKIRRAARA